MMLDDWSDQAIKISLFSDVKNSAHLKDVLLNGDGNARDPHLRGAVIDLSLVATTFHLKVAVHKALMNEAKGCMKTNSISSEIMYQLSGTRKISVALTQYSVAESCTNLAIIDVSKSIDDSLGHFEKAVDGVAMDGSTFDALILQDDHKAANLSKAFKLSSPERQVYGIEDSVLSTLAIKDL